MKSYREQTYYELLEVEPSCSRNEVRNAYDRALRLYDADSVALYPVGDPSEIEALKKLLLEAMEILTDDDLRVEYDRTLGIDPSVRAMATPPGGPEVPGTPEPTPDAKEIDERADESREEADHAHTHEMEDEVAPALHPHVTDKPLEHPAPPEPTEAPVTGPSADEIDERADESREEADKEEEKQAHDGMELQPSQRVMHDLVARAGTVHSTHPRYAISYVQQPSPEILEVDDSAIIPIADGHSESAASNTAQPAAESAGPTALAPPLPAPDPELAPAPPAPPLPPPLPQQRPASNELARAQHLAHEEAIATAESALAEVSHLARLRQAKLTPPPAPAVTPPTPPKPRIEIGPDAEINGELLRSVRESKGMTLHQVADRTRISTRHLEAVEADRYDALPPTVYLRGILMSVARELGLDPLRAARSYMALVEKTLVKPK